MLSLVELERVAETISRVLVGGRVERWVEPDRGRLAFSVYRRTGGSAAEASEREAGMETAQAGSPGTSSSSKDVFLVDARPDVAHFGAIARMPKAPSQMPAFAAYLRAHLSRARLESARLRGGDRQLELGFSAREGDYRLLLSIFGRRSNLYLLDASDTLLLALRPLAETRPELTLGQAYSDPGSAAPRRGEDRFEGLLGMELLMAIGSRYAEEVEERSADGDRRQLLAALKKERKSAERRLARIESELAEAEIANTLGQHGELLKANLGRVVAGEASVVVEDFETGEPVEIALDPKLNASENLNAIFKRYQKFLRRMSKAGGQIDSARANVEMLTALDAEIREAPELDAILSRPEVARLLGRHETRRGGQPGEAKPEKALLPGVYRSLPRKLHPRRYRSGEGLEIWVGRSDEANDVLTTRLARGKDLFFHLDGAPGSHVILRTEGRDDPPAESVLDACELAVHFSKQKNAGRADVHVVPIKQVKKPKGAKRGLVYVSGGKSIHLRREPARLARLLDSKFDD